MTHSHDYTSHDDIPDSAIHECYEEFWRPFLSLVPRVDDIKAELYDYHGLLQDLPLLFDEITGGEVSKPSTKISAVLGVYREHTNHLIEEAIKEHDEAASRDKEEGWEPGGDMGIHIPGKVPA